jgi:hypothetical protein
MNNDKTERYNSVRIEWAPILNVYEYKILDVLLFYSNLTQANEGKGYLFHVRTIARQCNIPAGTVSKTLSTFPFIIKHGVNKAMSIEMDYNKCIEWIEGKLKRSKTTVSDKYIKTLTVSQGNGDCFPGKPISNSIKGTCTKPDVTFDNQPKNINNKAGFDCVSNNSIGSVPVPDNKDNSNIPVPSIRPAQQFNSGPAAYKKDTTVSRGNSDRYILSSDPMDIIPCELPKTIQNIPSAIRQKFICDEINSITSGNLCITSKGYIKDGYKSIAGIDETNKHILITADDEDFIINPRIQEMIRHFKEQKFMVFFYVGSKQSVSVVKKYKSLDNTNTKQEGKTYQCVIRKQIAGL